jgi:AcrR family transcriptional regulator
MQEVRKKIMAVALEEFAENGLEGTRLESIAERANVELGAVRALFADKESLLRILLHEESIPIIDAIVLAVEEVDDAKEFMRTSIRLLDRWFLDHPLVIRLFMRCALEGASPAKFVSEHISLPMDYFERIQYFIDKGDIHIKDAEMVFTLVDSLVFLVHMMLPILQLQFPGKTAEQLIDRRYAALIDLLENGLYTK